MIWERGLDAGKHFAILARHFSSEMTAKMAEALSIKDGVKGKCLFKISGIEG